MRAKPSPWAAKAVGYPLSDDGTCGPAAWPELYDARGRFRYIRSDTGHSDGGQDEGVPRFVRKDGWTLVFLWDRSADKRGGCCAAFAFDAELPDAEALATARRFFPEVFARIETHLGRVVGVLP